MPPIAGVRTYLAGPAADFGSLRPFAAYQNVRTVDFIEGAIPRAVLRDALFFAADIQNERFTLHARRSMHARHLQEIGYVLGVVDLVEESLPKPAVL